MPANVKKFIILSPLSQWVSDNFRARPVTAGGHKIDVNKIVVLLSTEEMIHREMSNSAKNNSHRKVKCHTRRSSSNIASINHRFIDEIVHFNYSEATLTTY